MPAVQPVVPFIQTARGLVREWDQSTLSRLPWVKVGTAVGMGLGFVSGWRNGGSFIGSVGGALLGVAKGAAFGAGVVKTVGYGVNAVLRSTPPGMEKQQYVQAQRTLTDANNTNAQTLKILGNTSPCDRRTTSEQATLINRDVTKIRQSTDALVTALGKEEELGLLSLDQKIAVLAQQVPQWTGANTQVVTQITDVLGMTEELAEVPLTERTAIAAAAMLEATAEREAIIEEQDDKITQAMTAMTSSMSSASSSSSSSGSGEHKEDPMVTALKKKSPLATSYQPLFARGGRGGRGRGGHVRGGRGSHRGAH